MSSPITFSGFNNIDFNSVLNALMTQASQPLTALQTRQSALQAQVTTFSTFKTKVLALQSASEDLDSADDLSTLSGSSSDASAVAVSTASNAAAGHYEVIVNDLARAQVTATQSTVPDANTTVVASGGTLTIGGVAVAITSDSTLQQVATAINTTTGIGVTASVIRSGTSAYKLALTSHLSGTEHAFTISNGLTGGTGITFTDTDGDLVSGDSAADNAVAAADASLLVNNIAVTSSSNTLEDVLPGVTITALKKDPAAKIRIDVEGDSSALEGKLKTFVSAYNDVVKFMDDQRVSAARGDKASIGNDPALRQVRNALRSKLLGSHGSEAFTRLGEVGVEFLVGGGLKLDTTKLSAAIASNADAVRNLFGGTDGVFKTVTTALDAYSTGAGLIRSITDRLKDQISAMDNQIASLQTRLATQRISLQTQFTEADAAMTRLKNQTGSLSSLSS